MNKTTERELKALNKIYRAVHDEVCPQCGDDILLRQELRSGARKYLCAHCGFYVTPVEMDEMREAVAEWGKDIVMTFSIWRAGRRVERVREKHPDWTMKEISNYIIGTDE